jgi:NAD-specific glutamate dehydrogenase
VLDLVDTLVLGIVERLVNRADHALDQGASQLVQLVLGQPGLEVFRDAGVDGQKRDRDLRLGARRQLDLRALGRLVEALHRHRVRRHVDALLARELRRQPLDDRLVEVVAAEVVVTGRGLDLEDAVADLQHGDVERAAPEVEDEDRLVFLLIEPVRQRRGGRLVDDPLHVQAGDVAGVLRGLSLVVVEIRRDGDDSRVDGLTQDPLGVALELLQDHRRDLRRRIRPAVHQDRRVSVRPLDKRVGRDLLLGADLGRLAAHQPLDRRERAGGVGDRLSLGRLADQERAVLGKRHARRRRLVAFGVLEHCRRAGLHDGHAGVGRAEIDPDGLGHGDSESDATSCVWGRPGCERVVTRWRGPSGSIWDTATRASPRSTTCGRW